jgi:hypothetical protein
MSSRLFTKLKKKQPARIRGAATDRNTLVHGADRNFDRPARSVSSALQPTDKVHLEPSNRCDRACDATQAYEPTSQVHRHCHNPEPGGAKPGLRRQRHRPGVPWVSFNDADRAIFAARWYDRSRKWFCESCGFRIVEDGIARQRCRTPRRPGGMPPSSSDTASPYVQGWAAKGRVRCCHADDR